MVLSTKIVYMVSKAAILQGNLRDQQEMQWQLYSTNFQSKFFRPY